MSSTNQSPEYQKAELNFLKAQTNEEKLRWLEEMIRECPKHKSSEKMLANLKTRYIKLKEKIERSEKTSRGASKKGIKKEYMQAVIVGFTNSGKSKLMSQITSNSPEIGDYEFTTKYPEVGTMDFDGVKIQIIEIPAIESEYYDRGLVHSADVVLLLVNEISEIEEIAKKLSKSRGGKIIIFNNKKNFDERKVEATLKSKKLNYFMIDLSSKSSIEKLKEKIFFSFGKIRVYTKEPGREKSEKPFVLNKNSEIEEIAKKIFHNDVKIKEIKIWGPSSKFPGQVVGLKHELKDLDVVEFRTK